MITEINTGNEEIWLPIEGYEGHYDISNNGRIRTHKNFAGLKYLLQIKEKNGYTKVGLRLPKTKAKHIRIHRLVAQAFIPNPENKPMVNHINGIKHDNRIENLEWCTAKENVQHAYSTGLQYSPSGEDSGKSKLTQEQVLKIREMYNNNKRYGILKELSISYNVSITCIKDIIRRRLWKHI